MSRKYKNIITIAFLSIFILHTCSITLFPHKHIINGVVYIHSHPYEKDSNGNPKHSHDLGEIYTIQVLTHIWVTPLIFNSFLQKITTYVIRLITKILDLFYYALLIGNLRLRAPPKLKSQI